MLRSPRVRRRATLLGVPSVHASLVYADAKGQILDHPDLAMAGSAAGRLVSPEPEDLIPLPAGSELFLLPDRLPVGLDPRSGGSVTLDQDPVDGGTVTAIAAFVAPAHTQLLSAAYAGKPGARVLPLFAYTAVGWRDGGFVVPAMRVDPDTRQDIGTYDARTLTRSTQRRLRDEPDNRLLRHLGRCALESGCPAARNLFLGRWEAPLPCSPGCNASCVGCISRQTDSGICATQERIDFVPTPDEIAGVAVPHLVRAARAVASFGQGCEGEPLLQADTIAAAIRRIRAATPRGTVNLNTNASLPERVAQLADAGLDSMRVSLSSARPSYYERYVRPHGFGFASVLESIGQMKRKRRHVSLNYFILPGFTDEPEEIEALARLVDQTGVDMIQMRNLNIDPEWYLGRIGHTPRGQPRGIRALRDDLARAFPALRFGYFNPCLDPAAGP
jgi:pyruvate-formate lyase-activating enzyme